MLDIGREPVRRDGLEQGHELRVIEFFEPAVARGLGEPDSLRLGAHLRQVGQRGVLRGRVRLGLRLGGGRRRGCRRKHG
ncbi:MAG: hypothetical protein WDN30_13970 [Pararobbsia sp.]